jgi:hypothetical protein
MVKDFFWNLFWKPVKSNLILAALFLVEIFWFLVLEWERWIHIAFLIGTGILSIYLNDGRYFVAAAGGATVYSLLWFKLAVSKRW